MSSLWLLVAEAAFLESTLMRVNWTKVSSSVFHQDYALKLQAFPLGSSYIVFLM